MLSDLHQLLLDRLQQQGVNTDEAPALPRDLSKILESNSGNRHRDCEFSRTYYNEKYSNVVYINCNFSIKITI
jgi:hypothetical protein